MMPPTKISLIHSVIHSIISLGHLLYSPLPSAGRGRENCRMEISRTTRTAAVQHHAHQRDAATGHQLFHALAFY